MFSVRIADRNHSGFDAILFDKDAEFFLGNLTVGQFLKDEAKRLAVTERLQHLISTGTEVDICIRSYKTFNPPAPISDGQEVKRFAVFGSNIFPPPSSSSSSTSGDSASGAGAGAGGEEKT